MLFFASQTWQITSKDCFSICIKLYLVVAWLCSSRQNRAGTVTTEVTTDKALITSEIASIV